MTNVHYLLELGTTLSRRSLVMIATRLPARGAPCGLASPAVERHSARRAAPIRPAVPARRSPRTSAARRSVRRRTTGCRRCDAHASPMPATAAVNSASVWALTILARQSNLPVLRTRPSSCAASRLSALLRAGCHVDRIFYRPRDAGPKSPVCRSASLWIGLGLPPTCTTKRRSWIAWPTCGGST